MKSSGDGEEFADAHNNQPQPPFEFVDFESMPGTPCPCGTAKRGLVEATDFPGTIHVTDISLNARTHFHKEHSEVYYILSCETGAALELNHRQYPVRPGSCVLIRPGTFHRAVGKMKVLIVSMPKFDPQDEHFGDGNA